MFRSLLAKALIFGGLAAITSALGLVALTSSATTAAAFDPPWPDHVYGVPTDFEAGAANGWYFWHDLDSGHFKVCTTTPSDEAHPFIGRLTTNGGFFDISKLRLEAADEIQLTNGGNTLLVRFHTHSGVDRVEFRVPGTKLNLRLTELATSCRKATSLSATTTSIRPPILSRSTADPPSANQGTGRP